MKEPAKSSGTSCESLLEATGKELKGEGVPPAPGGGITVEATGKELKVSCDWGFSPSLKREATGKELKAEVEGCEHLIPGAEVLEATGKELKAKMFSISSGSYWKKVQKQLGKN